MPVRTFAACLTHMIEHIPSPPEIPPLTPNSWADWTEYREADADAPAAERRSRPRGGTAPHSDRPLAQNTACRFPFRVRSARHVVMNTSLDMRAEQLSTVAGAIDDLRDQLHAAEMVRDTLMRDMRLEGYSAIKLSKLAGLVRSRTYQILEGPLPQDDEVYAAMAERIEDAWQYACDQWFESDRDGSTTPDDYFPLERLLARP